MFLKKSGMLVFCEIFNIYGSDIHAAVKCTAGAGHRTGDRKWKCTVLELRGVVCNISRYNVINSTCVL